MRDPDKPCFHLDFAATVEVNRLFNDGDESRAEEMLPDAFSASVRVICSDCGEEFRWIGCPGGVLPDRPAVSVDEAELRAPIRPATSDDDFGLGIPGFHIR